MACAITRGCDGEATTNVFCGDACITFTGLGDIGLEAETT